jgi:hemerythrin
MAKVEWSNDLSVGVTLIDEQHKALIRCLNDVSSAIEARQGEREIVKALGFLSEYTDFHFSTEEKHMKNNSYSGLEEHEGQHQEFRGTLAGLEQDFEEEGSTKALADSISTFLARWLINHIQGTDQQFAKFLGDNGIVITEDE